MKHHFAGHKYTQEVLLFNLVSLSWETKPIYGKLPVGRGYHATVLHDHRLVVIGGYNGYSHFDTMISLDLASHSYLPQVTSFSVDEVSKRLIESKE
jgi:N-acetylneuraminic acid mutarotase